MTIFLVLLGLAVPFSGKAELKKLPVNEFNLTCTREEWKNLEGRKVYFARSNYLNEHDYLIFSKTSIDPEVIDRACASIGAVIAVAKNQGGFLQLEKRDYMHKSACYPNSSEWGVPRGGGYRLFTAVNEISFPENLNAVHAGPSQRVEYSDERCLD